MPGVTVFPSAPTGLPGLGSSKWTSPPARESAPTKTPATAAVKTSAPSQDDSFVLSIKTHARDMVQKEARGASSISLLKSARTQLALGTALESSGDIQQALSVYTKVATLAKMAMDSSEFAAESRSGRGGVLRQQLTEFLDHEAKDLGPRINKLEDTLRKMQPIPSSSSPDDKPGGSIADRMKALQDSGMNISPSTKRVSRDMGAPISNPTPIATSAASTSTSTATSRPLPIPTSNPITLTPPGTIPSSPNVSTHPSPHSFVSPSTLAPSPTSSPSSSPRNGTLTLDEFSHNFPSIDELDENFHMPQAPTYYSASANRSGDGSQPRAFAFPPIERPSSTPLVPLGNTFSSRPASPVRSSIPHKPSNLASEKSSLPRKNTATPQEVQSYMRDRKVLIIDVRPRADYEREHIRAAAVLCVDPVLLRRGNITAQNLEDSMVLAPKQELSLFSNRDKFDLVIIYDLDSTSFGPDSPLELLTQVICEREFRKILKTMPMMLLGGLNAWKREFGDEGVSQGDASGSNYASPVIAPTPKLPPPPPTNGVMMPTSPRVPNGAAPPMTASLSSSSASASASREPRSPPRQLVNTQDVRISPMTNGHHASFSVDQSSHHARSPAETSNRSSVDAKGLARRPAMNRSQMSSSASTSIQQTFADNVQPLSIGHSISVNGSGGTITYPSFQRRISPQHTSIAGPSSSYAPSSSSYVPPSSYDITSPPLASISPSLSRRRSDYIDQSREVINNLSSQHQQQPRSPIDYPDLNRHTTAPTPVLRPPPAVAPSAHERQDMRPRVGTFSSPQLNDPAPPRLNSDYPVTFWFADQIGLSGLKNLGNTCYMNAPIQCLSASVPFARFFLDKRWETAINHMNPMGSHGRLTAAFASLVREMWSQDMPSLAPSDFRKQIIALNSQYQGYDQHDSQEFLSFLLDGIHEDLNRMLPVQNKRVADRTPEEEAAFERLPAQLASDQEWQAWKRRNDSIIVDYFQGQFRSRLECMTCSHTSTTYNVFSTLQLPIPRDRSGKMALQRCLEALFSTETLEGDNAWDCPKCKAKRKARTQLSLARLPPILLIHLKRFEINGRFSDKIDTFVDFPLKALDLTSFMPPSITANGAGLSNDPRVQLPPYRYDLYGVTNHYGNLSSGHYTAYISSRGGWKYCDDQSIRDAEPKQVVNQKAYVLFYKRSKA